jgi:hypothetical protein
MTVAIYHNEQKGKYCIFDVDTKVYIEEDNLPKYTEQDLVITYDQIFPSRAKIHDICVAEKIIYFPGPKTLSRLNHKYFHKYEPAKKTEQLLRNIYRIYKEQIKETVDQYLSKSVNFENGIAGTIAFINSKKITLKNSFLEEFEEKRDLYKKGGLLTKKQIIEILIKNHIDLFKKGTWDLTHEKLIKTDIPEIIKHVEKAKMAANFTYEKQFYSKSLNIRHNQFGAVTGRISTSNPNIQGIQKKWIEGNIYSFDFTSFEVMIYLSLYNPDIIYDFEDSKEKDLYMYLFNLVTKNRAKEERRTDFKFLTIMILYGADAENCKYRYGEFSTYLYPRITKLFGIDKVKESLMESVKRTGRYLIVPDISYTIQDRLSFLFKKNYPLAKDFKRKYGKELSIEYWSDNPKIFESRTKFHDKLIYEKGVVMETYEIHDRLNELVLNYHIQGFGAYIIKLCAKALLPKIKSQILIMRHDEFIVDITDEKDLDIIPSVMKNVFFKYTKSNINVKCQKI